MNRKFVSWRRVSTKKQDNSGLGLEAQKEIIRYFIEREGGTLIADYAECYTGKDLNGCAELRKAMAHAKREGAVLIISKTDRFRNTQEALQIYEQMGDGNIMFCDLPHTDKFTLTIFFALAEREALIVSIRTKQALAVKKAQGAALGAASETYRQNYEAKSKEEKLATARKRGRSHSTNMVNKPDVTALRKIFSIVFSQEGEESTWDWNAINTKTQHRKRIIELMSAFKTADPNLFSEWKLDMSVETQTKMSNIIQKLRRYYGETIRVAVQGEAA